MVVRVVFDPKESLFKPFYLVCKKCNRTLEVNKLQDIFYRYLHGTKNWVGERILYVGCPTPCNELVIIPPETPRYDQFVEYVVINYKLMGANLPRRFIKRR